jgi:hypothetical protein
MPRNGHSATKAIEPQDLYDTLTQDEQDTFDQIGVMGYVPEKGVTGLWLAKKRGDSRSVTVGPANSIQDLLSRVREDVATDAEFDNDIDSDTEEAGATTELNEGEILLTEDHKGNRYLPGAEEVVDQQLKDAAYNEFTDKQAWNEAGKKKKQSKDALDAIAASKKHLFYPDPAKSSDLIYKCGGITVRMAKDFTVKTKTELTKEDEDED